MKLAVALLVGLVLGVAAARWHAAQDGVAADPVPVLTQQLRARASLRRARQLAVWYRACPDGPGPDPEAVVVWPGQLHYSVDLSGAQLELARDVLIVRTPPIVVNEPTVPADLGGYVTTSSLWTLPGEQSLVLAEMQKAAPLARHLGVYLLAQDPELENGFRAELVESLRGIAGALGTTVARVEVEIATAKRTLPPRPDLELCAGTAALANGRAFARRQADGAIVGVYDR